MGRREGFICLGLGELLGVEEKGVEIESAASQVMQIISFNLLLKITQSQVKEGLQGLSHCYCQGGTDLGCL